ncbi:GIN domain-containing protein [Capnocytophaga gingivalis]|uniref:GIN domain-containing protein n=1 Tax=Capnocytophaga gingivalis TaxID=1017 RepID=UPI003C72AF55
MKRIVILCTCLLLWIGCSHSFPVIKGDNSIISKERNLPSYSQINLECGADIILTKGQVGNITLKASQNIEPYVITEVTNGVLTIKLSPDFSFQFTRKLELYIPVDESLSKISVSGSGDISSREQLHVKKLTCKVVGSGDIDLSLQADSLSVSIKGSGDMDIKGTTELLM